MKWPVKWTSKTIHVDIDTGEQITKHNAKTNYTKIKTIKHATFSNESKTRGIIEWTTLYRNRKQGELPFDNP